MVRKAARRAVFLDRDGVLVRPVLRRRKPYAARRLGEAQFLPGVPGAVARLKRAGYLTVVV